MGSATIGSFFYVVLSAIGTGLTTSCIRWLTIDSLHYWTGLRPPAWSFSQLAGRTEAYHLLNENHYKYYQFYANSVVAIIFAYCAWRSKHSLDDAPLGWAELWSLGLVVIFFAGSRDTLGRFYQRLGEVLEAEQQAPSKRRRKRKRKS